jgi:putative phosphoesterase
MLYAVLSDTHDNIWKLEAALPTLANADVLFHCGDLCAPFVVKMLGEAISEKPIHIIWGNNDGDPGLITKVTQGYPNINLHGQFAMLEVGGRKVALNHYPELARGLAYTGDFDLVFFGHNHIASEERIKDCLLLNPGELMGLNGRSTFAIVDSNSLFVEWIEI